VRYEKGRKDASRQRIMDAAAARFRRDGIAATGLAAIMGDAGMTNGAFYPHFRSKAELVGETVGAAIDAQAAEMREAVAAGGIEALIAGYLSPAHRDSQATGCTPAALLPELARQPLEIRAACAERFTEMARDLAAALPPGTPDPQGTALAVYATLLGSLQLARVAAGTDLSDRILAAGADAARALAGYGGPVTVTRA
jgi:TetR/AcrR family transcriptional repressor of nem operon